MLVVSVDSCYVCDRAVGLGLVEVAGLVYWLVCVLCGVFYCVRVVLVVWFCYYGYLVSLIVLVAGLLCIACMGWLRV